MLDKGKSIQEFRDVSQSVSNKYLEAWKQQGGKVVGYVYSYIPEELIMAAGAVPYRVRATGSEETTLSSPYYTDINCGVVRYLFNLVLNGDYDFLDGLVGSNVCDQMRRTYDNWESLAETPCCGFVYIPKARTDFGFEAYAQTLAELRASLEERLGVTITDQAIVSAIAKKNQVRVLQRKLYEFMKLDKPPISGADVHAAVIAGSSMPVDDYLALLADLVESLKGQEAADAPTARFVIAGAELDSTQLIDAIETQGGSVVASSMLYGVLGCYEDVPEASESPLETLAKFYFYGPAYLPRVMGALEGRHDFVAQLVADFKADGVVSYATPFCEQGEFDQSFLGTYLENKGIRHLALNCDYPLNGEGQIKTRVQAFQETL